MTYEEANSVKELAADNYEVLKNLDIKCIKCDGSGYIDKGLHFPKCKNCNGTGKIKWKWKVKMGGWCIGKNYKTKTPLLITETTDKTGWLQVNCQYWKDELPSNFIPILHWEEIEKILEKAGYRVDINRANPIESYKKSYKYECVIIGGSSRFLADVYAESCQKAVMLAVIELGDEII